jgi:peptidyl-prolyl cis-trans isomerase A (cyclophilin A)
MHDGGFTMSGWRFLLVLVAMLGAVACSGGHHVTHEEEGADAAQTAGEVESDPGAAEGQVADAETAEAEGAYGPQNLLDPTNPLINEVAPDEYRARFETSKGAFVIEVQRDWAPRGADRFYNLVRNGFFDDARFFRCIQGFMVQFGISGDPSVSQALNGWNIQDDPVKLGNKRGNISFAKKNLPHSRTTQVFINFVDNDGLDGMGFASFGKVVEGMDVVDQLYSGYGESQQGGGKGPIQAHIEMRGNEYLKESFPQLDFVKRATIVQD